MSALTDFFGDVISTYTEDQAIEDGVLVHPFPNRWPWLLITASVHADCKAESKKGRTYDQALVPLLMDAIMAVQKKINRDPQCDLIKLEGTVAGTVWIRPNGKGGMTVMKPSDN